MTIILDAESEKILLKMMEYGPFKEPAEVVAKALKLFYRKHAKTDHMAGDPTKDPAYKLVEDLPGEIWQALPSYPGYEASSLGRVRSTRFGKLKMLSLTAFQGNYKRVTIAKDRKTVRPLAHCLVAEAFLPQEEGRPVVNHKDGNKSNNAAANLERLSFRENINHSVLTGLHSFGEKHGKSKLSDLEILEIIAAKERGEQAAALASQYGVSVGHINNIAAGKYRVRSKIV